MKRKEVVISAIIILLSLASLLVATKLTADEVQVPNRITRSAGVRPTEPPRTPVQVAPVPVPTPKPKETLIYVTVTKVNKIWQVTNSLADWNLADKFVEFKQVKSCPVAEPCLRIHNKLMSIDTAGETIFQDDGYSIDIYFNSRITNGFAAHSTTCHEIGHVLGLPHISGTVDTCMTAIDGFFRTHPSKLDSRLVNSYGPWNLYKMYELSGKDVDARSLPK